jgi:hypothetical protein
MNERVISVRQLNPRQTLISVADEATGLRDFLESKNITVSPLSSENIKVKTWKFDSDRRPYSDDFWTAREFVADVHFEDVNGLINEWLSAGSPLFGKIGKVPDA